VFGGPFRFLFGEVSSVYAELRRLNPVIAGEDSGTVLCEFRNSVSVLFDGNRLVDHEAEDTRLTMGEMLIEGAAGVLRLNGQGRIFFRKCGEQENEHEYAWESCGFAGDCVFSCQSHVVSHLLNGTQLQNSGREYLRNLELEEAIYESHRQQRRMQV
jgi:predicted dehydrogenase